MRSQGGETRACCDADLTQPRRAATARAGRNGAAKPISIRTGTGFELVIRGNVPAHRSVGPQRLVFLLFAGALAGALLAASLLGRASPVAAASCPESGDGFGLASVRGPGLLAEDVYQVGYDKVLVAGSVRSKGGRRSARLASFGRAGWKTILTRAAGNDAGFVSFGGSTRTGLWAVGYRQTLTDLEPLAMHQNSAGKWRDRSPGNGGAHGATLTDIAAYRTSTAWAVGYRRAGPGVHRPFIMKWGHQRWTQLSPRLHPGENGMLSATSSTKAGGTWIAGWTSSGSSERPYIARRAGGSWKRLSLPAVGVGALSSISVPTKTNGWAVGYRMTAAGSRPLVLRWDGSAWKEVSPPRFAGETVLYDVDIKQGTVTVAGSTRVGKRARPFMARFAAPGWDVDILEVLSRDGLMTGVDGAWSSARDIGHGVVQRGCGGSIVATPATKAKPGAKKGRAKAAAVDSTGAQSKISAQSAGRNVRMVDKAASAGLPTRGHTYGAVIADFDGDGRQDIFLSGHADKAHLYLDRGTAYEQRSTDFGEGDRHDCAASDVDSSGLPDLYCTFGGARGTSVRGNQLWLDPGGPHPRLTWGTGTAAELLGRGRAAAFLDYDDDGREDLVIGAQADRLDGLPSVSRVYRRTGNADFAPVRGSGLTPLLSVGHFDTGDYDQDGRTDLLMSVNDPRSSGRSKDLRLYRNTPSGFRNVTASSGISYLPVQDARLVNVGGSKRLDLVQLSRDRIRISIWRDGKFRTTWERSIGGATAVAAGDADGDGDLDLYVLRQKNSSATRDLVLFNKGDGSAFRVVPAPSRPGGKADAVVAIDHDQNRLTDFLVMNGRGTARGPLQLIAFYRK